MFSTSMIASSTTAPSAITNPARVIVLIVSPRQESTLLLPIDVDHGQLIGAAGAGILSGGELPARLSGSLTVRLPRGDVSVPLDLSGRLSLR